MMATLMGAISRETIVDSNGTDRQYLTFDRTTYLTLLYAVKIVCQPGSSRGAAQGHQLWRTHVCFVRLAIKIAIESIRPIDE